MREKFDMILDQDEEVIWCNGIHVSAYVKKNFLKTFLFGMFPPIAVIMLGIPYSWLLLILSILQVIPMWIGIAHFVFSIVACLIYLLILNKDAKNTFCCITDKRVIKRSGAFSNDFKQYSLKNIGNVEVDGSIFDRKGDHPSATLLLTVKDYHTNTDGNTRPMTLRIDSLTDAYEAYKLINELTEGNNDSFRIKVEP